jgi:hypothetical protein
MISFVTPDIEHLQTYLPLPHLPTIPNHPFAFLLRKKAVDGKDHGNKEKLESKDQ